RISGFQVLGGLSYAERGHLPGHQALPGVPSPSRRPTRSRKEHVMSDHRRPKKAGNSMTSQARVPNGAKPALTRRQFLKITAVATGAVIAAPRFIRAEALGLNGGTAANSRCVLGGS